MSLRSLVPSPARRRLALLLAVPTLLVGTGALGARWSRSSSVRADVAQADREAVGLVDSLVWRATAGPGRPSVEASVAVGYLERLRLGLGSPFRLADFAARDPRLSPSIRGRLVRALVLRTRDREGYAIPEEGLRALAVRRDSVDPVRIRVVVERGLQGDPIEGELALRLAAGLAAARGDLHADGVHRLAMVAALLRDRELAARDAAALLRATRAAPETLPQLLAEWRVARRLQVERPAGAPPPLDVERRAMHRAPALAAALAFAVRPVSDTARFSASASLLVVRAAERLSTSARWMPPQAPVVVSLRARLGDDRTARRLAERALNEEAFSAELVFARRAYATSDDRAGASRLAGAWLDAAVALRAYAQEAPWFPGDPALGADELRARYGIAGVRFAPEVPTRWRPYYRRMLAQSMDDVRLVYPALRLDGMRVVIGGGPSVAGALALHVPRTRTLELPMHTAAGAIAHELAHELDWREARRAGGAGYATDRAAAARGRPGVQGERPTERFARRTDGEIAAALARVGRTGGYLTSVQDAVLAGYVAAIPADEPRSLSALRQVRSATRGRALEAQWKDWEGALTIPLASTGGGELLCGRVVRTEDEGRFVREAAMARAEGILRRRALWWEHRRAREPTTRVPEWVPALTGRAPWSHAAASAEIARVGERIVRQVDAPACTLDS